MAELRLAQSRWSKLHRPRRLPEMGDFLGADRNNTEFSSLHSLRLAETFGARQSNGLAPMLALAFFGANARMSRGDSYKRAMLAWRGVGGKRRHGFSQDIPSPLLAGRGAKDNRIQGFAQRAFATPSSKMASGLCGGRGSSRSRPPVLAWRCSSLAWRRRVLKMGKIVFRIELIGLDRLAWLGRGFFWSLRKAWRAGSRGASVLFSILRATTAYIRGACQKPAPRHPL